MTTGDKVKIDRIIRKAERIVGTQLTSHEDLFHKLSIAKALNILKDPKHPLFHEFVRSNRSNRIIIPTIRTERYRNSFIPSTSKRLSSSSIR